MTENELRQAVVAQARTWLGCNEYDGTHRPIIDLYNKFKRPGDYTMTYYDPWCAAFTSAVGMAVAVAHSLACKPYELIPSSAACDPKIAQYKAMGRWVEDDSYLPSPGDEIFYDWEDSGYGDDQGSSDHVGLVTDVDKVTGDITVIEGNKSDSVCYRNIRRDGRYIRGYGLPDYAKYADGGDDPQQEPTPEPQPTPTQGIQLPTLRQGDGMNNPNECVRAAQLLLIGRGFRCGPWGADGEFGSATYGAVYMFQQAKGLYVDGVIGDKTWRKLLGVT